MQKRNDIYNQESRKLPKRRSARSASQGVDGEEHSLYGERERRSTLTEDLRSRPSNQPRTSSSRNRRQRPQGMSLTNKLVLTFLVVLLIGYLGILGASVYRSQKQRAAPAPGPVLVETTSAEGVEAIETAEQTEEKVLDHMQLAEEEAVRTDAHIVSWKAALVSLDRARASLDRGEWVSVVERLEGAIESAPHLVDLKLALADTYMDQKRFAAARDLYVRVLATDPLKEGVRLKWAQALMALQQYDAAVLIARWLLEEDAFLEEPNQIAAMAYLATDRTAEAIPHLRRQVSINRDNIVAQNNLAVAYSRMGDYSRAVTLFREVLEADPTNAITYYNLAVSYAQQGDAQLAVNILQRAMDRFGMAFVSAWFRSKDFDPIRGSESFGALESLWNADDEPLQPNGRSPGDA